VTAGWAALAGGSEYVAHRACALQGRILPSVPLTALKQLRVHLVQRLEFADLGLHKDLAVAPDGALLRALKAVHVVVVVVNDFHPDRSVADLDGELDPEQPALLLVEVQGHVGTVRVSHPDTEDSALTHLRLAQRRQCVLLLLQRQQARHGNGVHLLAVQGESVLVQLLDAVVDAEPALVAGDHLDRVELHAVGFGFDSRACLAGQVDDPFPGEGNGPGRSEELAAGLLLVGLRLCELGLAANGLHCLVDDGPGCGRIVGAGWGWREREDECQGGESAHRILLRGWRTTRGPVSPAPGSR
jgi:hypothetical protein